MNKRTECPSLLALFVVVLFTYFGIVHPSVHFHHSHEDTAWPLELSLHPVDIEPEHIPEHHGDHHHHDFRQYVERRLPLRQQATTIKLPMEVAAVFVWHKHHIPVQSFQSAVDDSELQWRFSYLPSVLSLRGPPFSS